MHVVAQCGNFWLHAQVTATSYRYFARGGKRGGLR